jgi:transcriptional regulator with XRE-family HTH domain
VPRRTPRNPLGEFIRNQREITRLSLRQLANLAHISNPYLSQVERGLFEPSAAILKAIAKALGIAPEKLYAVAGWLDGGSASDEAPSVESAIRTDPDLTTAEKEALLGVYRGFLKNREP